MTLRWAVWLLLTLNVCYLLWALVSPEPRRAAAPAWPEEVPDLRLAGELDGEAIPEPADTEAGADPVASIGVCWRIGPFDNAASRVDFVETHLGRWPVAVVEGVGEEAGDWRVYLPPAQDEEGAGELVVALREAFEAAGDAVPDSFVMTSGQWRHGVSLGLFRDESNALSLAGRVRERGLSVRVEREVVPRTVEWIEVFMPRRWMDDERRARMNPDGSGPRISENLCQMIAPQLHFP